MLDIYAGPMTRQFSQENSLALIDLVGSVIPRHILRRPHIPPNQEAFYCEIAVVGTGLGRTINPECIAFDSSEDLDL